MQHGNSPVELMTDPDMNGQLLVNVRLTAKSLHAAVLLHAPLKSGGCQNFDAL